MDQYKSYQYKGKTMLIDRYLVIGELECSKDKYDIFDLTLNRIVQEKILEISEKGYNEFKMYNDLTREGLNTFELFYKSNRKILLYSEVFSKTKTKVLICVCGSKTKSKLWLNGKCLSINQNWVFYYLSVTLKKGKNIIIFEEYSPEIDTNFSIQILNYKFEMSDDIRALSNMENIIQIDPLILIDESCYKPTEASYKFMYIKNGTAIKDDYIVDIYDSSTGFVETLTAKLGEVVEIYVDELRSLHTEALRHERISCVFKDKEDKDFVVNSCVIVNDFFQKAEKINEELLSLSKELPKIVYENVMGKILRLKSYIDKKDYPYSYWSAWLNKEMLNQLKTGTYPHDFYKKPGSHEFFIHSELDDSYIFMGARIPNNYDHNKVYPIFIALSTGNEGMFSKWLPEDELPETYLCFDVTGRGFTGGSYVGDASMLEIINWIKHNYKIDSDRIYVFGQSNGGYAAWALAQNYPHVPAAIFPQIGLPHIQTIDNVSAIPTYEMVSPKDYVYKGREKEIKNKLMKFGNYNEISFDEMLHNSFLFYIAHRRILEQMLAVKRNPFPGQVIYSTCRNRHLESFWIKLHGIEKGRKFAKIKAIVENKRLIKITVHGTEGVTVTLPPQIVKESFDISINNKVFHFDKQKKNQLNFIHCRTWRTEDFTTMVDYRKGTGLLDIYMNSLRIIIPKDSSDIMKKIAKNFSRPASNGILPEVFSNYPIYDENTVPDHVLGYNLLLIETVDYPNPYIRRFADKLPVQYNAIGYEYNSKQYVGDYVLMQIVANPYDNRLSMLIISTNNEKILIKDLFVRKVVIPYYESGLHPYWNNEVLIFDGKQYWGIYEYGMDIEEIK